MKKFQSERNRFIVLLTIIALSFILGIIFKIDKQVVKEFFDTIPLIYSSLAFILFYVVGTFFIWILKDILKIIGAVAFGAYLSTLFIYVAEIINAYIFFNLSKFMGKDFVEKSVKGKFKWVYERAETFNMGWLFLMRGVPLIPYRVLDVGFGLSKFPFRKYLIVVLLASLPRIFWIQFILASLKEMPLLGGITITNLVASIEVTLAYFQENNVMFIVSLVYFILAGIVAFRMRKRPK